MGAKKIAIFFATRLESDEILCDGKFGFKQTNCAPFETWENASRIVFISDVGLINAGACFAWATKNFDFDEAVNVGAAGVVRGDLKLGSVALIERCVCLEPYNYAKFDATENAPLTLEICGETLSACPQKTLGSASRPVVSERSRSGAASVCDLVDMEGYAFTRAAQVLGKKIALLKFASDFSPNCDIPKNIVRYRGVLENLRGLWDA